MHKYTLINTTDVLMLLGCLLSGQTIWCWITNLCAYICQSFLGPMKVKQYGCLKKITFIIMIEMAKIWIKSHTVLPVGDEPQKKLMVSERGRINHF